jgi:pimeloyl-ACP methyl ester carboxylesterase
MGLMSIWTVAQGQSTASFREKVSAPLQETLKKGLKNFKKEQGMIHKYAWKTSLGTIIVCALLIAFCPAVARADIDLSPTATVKKAYVDTQLGQIHYRYTTGPKNAPVLVLIHQSSSDSSMYEKVMARLGNHYSRIIAPDFPGYGDSFPINEQKDIAFYADVFMESLKNLEVKKFHVVGHHTGGFIALDMKVRFPKDIKTLNIIGVLYGTEEEKEPIRKICTEQNDQTIPVADGSHLLRGWNQVAQYGAANVSVEHHQREAMVHLKAWKGGAIAFSAALDYDFIGNFDKVEGPLMIMTSETDVLYPYFEPAKKARPDAETAIVEGWDYELDVDPDGCAKAIHGFIQKNK